MRRPNNIHLTFSLLGIILLSQAGCLGPGTNTPTRFYELSSLYSRQPPAAQVADLNQITVGVGPIRIPKKLDRPQIVTRINPNEIRLNDFTSWGDPLASGFSRVLAENLSVLLNTERIAIFPWMQAVQTDYQVTVDVTDFIGTPGSEVQLRAWWTVFGDNGRTLLVKRYFFSTEPASGDDITALVQAQSRTVETLSRKIAVSIKALSQGAKPAAKK
jgi:uncharacterized lipoprotein YmbA